MSRNVVRKVSILDVVATKSRVWSASAAEPYARTAPAGSYGTVLSIFDQMMEMYSGPKAGEDAHRATVAVVEFETLDGEKWQASINVNALTPVRRPRRLS